VALVLGLLVGDAGAFDLTTARGCADLTPPIAVDAEVWSFAPKSRTDWPQEVVELVNQERLANGHLPPLKKVDELDAASGLHSVNMADRDFMAHCDPDTLTLPWDRMVAAGYSFSSAAENIAAGYSSPAAVVAGWMASSGHRANILSTDFREIGVGYEYQGNDQGTVRRDTNGDCVPDSFNNGPYGHYWTQNFGKRSAVYPVVINREAASTSTSDVDLYIYGAGWAAEMRVRNESGSWTTWQAFASEVPWQLSGGPGTKEVFVEIRSGATVRGASDTILSTAPGLDEIFSDGFESGDTTRWSASVQ
jgi:uncharacterized protein YkwD